jgi:hypothetical protein
MRDAGFVADHIEFGGIPHIRLEAQVPHLCCNLCRSQPSGLRTRCRNGQPAELNGKAPRADRAKRWDANTRDYRKRQPSDRLC